MAVGHIACRTYDGVVEFCSGDCIPEATTWVGTSWADNLVKVAGTLWMQEAKIRSLWRDLGEAYVQEWTTFRRYYDGIV